MSSAGGGSGSEVEKETVSSLTGKMMIAAVAVLFVAVLFVVCLHLFARRLRRRSSNTVAAGDVASIGEVEDSSAVLPRKGLDAAIVGALPVLVVRAGLFKEGFECSVCLCELADGEKARLLPNCNHGFHLDCIDEWFHSHSTCPLCRDVIAPATASPRSGETPAGMQALSLEPLSFPTNVLFWGNEVEVVNTRVTRLEEVLPSSSSSSSSNVGQDNGDQENMKSNTATRFRSLKRLLTRDKRLVAPSIGDIEQGFDGDGQC